MIHIEKYISKLIELLKGKFESRLLYVGLQGSYLRREATDSSDIDIMVVIDELSVSDLAQYRDLIQSMDHFDRSCGFICSRADLSNWNPLEICQLLNGTKDYFGDLRELVPVYTEADIRNYVKLSINNLYHEICHRYIHAEFNKDVTALSTSYKSVFFVLQNHHYLLHGEFVATKKELLSKLTGLDCAVMKRSMDLNNGVTWGFDDSFALLFGWCQDIMMRL